MHLHITQTLICLYTQKTCLIQYIGFALYRSIEKLNPLYFDFERGPFQSFAVSTKDAIYDGLLLKICPFLAFQIIYIIASHNTDVFSYISLPNNSLN
jgi:hypothetical protein